MQPYGLLSGCQFGDLSKNTPVFNIYALGDWIWIHLPRWVILHELISVHDISAQVVTDIAYDDASLIYDGHRPWIKIRTSLLNLTSGQHIYKFIFKGKHSDDETLPMFVSYISRDNNPVTPYIYMPNRGNPVDTSTEEYDYTEEYVTDD